MRIALLQMAIGHEMEGNLVKALAWMERAAAGGAEAVVFPEVHLSRFFPQFAAQDASGYEMTLEHEMFRAIQDKSRDLGLVCFPNIYLREGEHCFDASPVIDRDGSILGVSKMVHILQAPCFFEQDYYTPSDTGFRVYDTEIGKVGIVICYDRHFPESIRSCTLQGAELIVVPTANTKGEPLELFEWEMRVAAAQNNVFIAMCNRVGREDQMEFCGESLVVDPDGGLLAKADDSEQILTAEIDLSRIEPARKVRPYLALRRPGSYF